MAFQSGRVSYCRFHVHGDAPSGFDDVAQSILREHAFRETEIGAPDEVEVGFTTGEHLLDTEFTYEKNGYGPLILLAMRMDTHRVPAEIKQAYRKINERAAADGNPSGFASKSQKREAKDLAGRQIQEDLASGKFRRSKSIPLLWDTAAGVLYCGATGNTAAEHLSRLMRQSFAVDLEPVTAGTLAGRVLRGGGHGRDYEDLSPSPFTAPPPEAHQDADDAEAAVGGPRSGSATPPVPWVTQAVDLKDFLGNEFALWLWWLTETAEGVVPIHRDGQPDGEAFVAIDKALDMDCAWGERGKQTLRGGGPTRLPEAGEALRTGKWPRKLGMILSDGEHQWELTLQADRMLVSSALLPEAPEASSPRELVEQRLLAVQALTGVLDGMYRRFLSVRTGGSWSGKRRAIREWIAARGG